jgi:hypothetical protein
MRVFVALFVFIFFSQSVYSATYATCNALDYNNDKEISLKLTWNKIFLNENNEGLKEWKKIKYTNEEIVISKTIPQKIYKCDWMCQLWKKSKYTREEIIVYKIIPQKKYDCRYELGCIFIQGEKEKIKKREETYNKLLDDTPFKNKYTITIDRISGELIENIETYSIYTKEDSKQTPYIKKFTLQRKYFCEKSDKTKF